MDTLYLNSDPFIANMLAFDNMKEQLERDHWDKWVIVSGLKLFGVYDSFDDAKAAANAAMPAIHNHYLAKVGERATVILSHGE